MLQYVIRGFFKCTSGRPESDSQERVEMAVAGHSLAQSRRMKGAKGREAVFPGRQWRTDDKGKGCRKREPDLKKGGCGRRRNER